MLLEVMKDKYLNYVKINLADGTYRCYRNHLNYIIGWLKQKNILNDHMVNNKILINFILEQHKHGVKNSTINKRIKPLKLMFKFNGLENEILNIVKLKEDKATFGALSTFELKCLVKYLNYSKIKLSNKLLFYLLIDTGVRVNELLNIKVKNINLFNKTILLEVTKTKKNRIVPFTDATLNLLELYLKEYRGEFLFNLKYSGIKSLFCRVQKKLGLSKFHPHMLRHTLASKLHKNGVSVIVIKDIMGHTNITTTERYIHFDLDDMLNVYNEAMKNLSFSLI